MLVLPVVFVAVLSEPTSPALFLLGSAIDGILFGASMGWAEDVTGNWSTLGVDWLGGWRRASGLRCSGGQARGVLALDCGGGLTWIAAQQAGPVSSRRPTGQGVLRALVRGVDLGSRGILATATRSVMGSPGAPFQADGLTAPR